MARSSSSPAQRRATAAHRSRSQSKGLKRVEVQAAAKDVEIVRALAAVLREDGAGADELRRRLREVAPGQRAETALTLFASDLPDDDFDAVFGQPRASGWREIDL